MYLGGMRRRELFGLRGDCGRWNDSEHNEKNQREINQPSKPRKNTRKHLKNRLGKSFRDALCPNGSISLSPDLCNALLQNNISSTVANHNQSSNEDLVPSLEIPEEIIDKLSLNWNRSLIIRMTDPVKDPETLKRRLLALWKIR